MNGTSNDFIENEFEQRRNNLLVTETKLLSYVCKWK